MAGIHFDITADNSNFISSVKEVGSEMRRTTKVLEEIGKRADMSSVEKQVVNLTKIIRDNEDQIRKFGINIENAMKGASEALERGDINAMGAFSRSIEMNAKAIADLNKETSEYRQTLDTINNFTGNDFGKQVTAPMLFINKEDYDYAEQLRKKIDDLQEKIAKFKGPDAELQKMRSELSENKNELSEVEVKAAETASKFGSLGSRLAESSTRFYALTDAIKEQIKKVEDLEAKYNKAAEALKKAQASRNPEAISNAQISYDLYGESLKNARLVLANLRSEMRDSQKEVQSATNSWSSFSSLLGRMPGPVGNLARQISSMAGEVKNATTSIEGMTLATEGSTAAMLSYIALPIIALLASVAAGYTAIRTWMDRTIEGQEELNIVTARYNEVFESLKDRVSIVGEEIYRKLDSITSKISEALGGLESLMGVGGMVYEGYKAAFNNSIIGRGKNIVDSFRKEGFWGGMKSIGKNTLNIQNVGEDKPGYNQIGPVGQFLTQGYGGALMKGWRKGSDFGKEVEEEVETAEELAKKENKLLEDERNFIKKRAELNQVISKGRRAYSLPLNEQVKAIEEAKNANKELMAQELDFANRRAEISRGRLDLNKSNMQQTKETLILESAVIDVQTKEMETNAMLERQLERAKKRSETESNKNAKYKKQENEYLLLLSKQEEAQIRSVQDMEYATTQAQINAMDDGTEKTIAQIQLDYEKEMTAIERGREDLARKKIEQAKQLFEKDPKNKNKVFDVTSVDISETEAETKYFDAQVEEQKKKKTKSIEEVQKTERQAMYDYLKEYGSIQQQKEAINAEYEEKILKETDAYHQEALRQQRDKTIQELNLKELQENINWEDMFKDMDYYSVSYLKKLKEQLRDALDASDINAENAKIIAEKINEIESKITEKTDVWGQIFPRLERRKQIVQETKDAYDELAASQARQVELSEKVSEDREKIAQAIRAAGVQEIDGIEVDLEFITQENYQKILSALDTSSPLYDAIKELFEKLGVDIKNLTGEQDKGSVQKKVLEAQWDKLKAIGSGNVNAADLFSIADTSNPLAYVKAISTNASGLAELVDTLGEGDSEFGQAVHNFADGCNSFNSATQKLMSGDVFGAVSDTIKGFESIGNIFNSGGAADKYYERDMQALTNSNEHLQKAIDRLADSMEEGDFLEIEEAYERQRELLAEKEKNTQEKLIRSMEDWKKADWLGRGHVDNAQEEIRKALSTEDWKSIAKTVGREDYRGWAIQDLSSTEAALLRKLDPAMWEKVLEAAEKGFRGEEAKAELEAWADLADEAKKSEDTRIEKLTGITFDNLRSNFRSTLLDMESDTEDTAQDISKIMAEALVDNLINKEFDKELKEWREKLAEALEVENESERKQKLKALKEEYLKYQQEARDKAVEIYDVTGYDPKYEDKQATANMAEKATYDQFELYLGIATAQQIALEQGNSVRDSILASIQSMADLTSPHGQAVNEIKGQILIANQYLFDIKEANRKFYEYMKGDFTENVKEIRDLIDERL